MKAKDELILDVIERAEARFKQTIKDVRTIIEKADREEASEKDWRWKPDSGEKYETIYWGDISGFYIRNNPWSNANIDNNLFNSFNVFKPGTAERYLNLTEPQRVVAMCLDYLQGTDDWIDWDRPSQDKFRFALVGNKININCMTIVKAVPNILHGQSEEIMYKCREMLGDELIIKAIG